MQPLRTHTGLAVPLDRPNVDTDQIIPKQFLKLIGRTGYGKFLFYDWRFGADGTKNPDFVLHEPRYERASQSEAPPIWHSAAGIPGMAFEAWHPGRRGMTPDSAAGFNHGMAVVSASSRSASPLAGFQRRGGATTMLRPW